MHKVHVTTRFEQDIERVFAVIADHRQFLSGGGLTCRLLKEGTPHKNGLGAIRSVRTQKYTLTEKITAYEHNKSYDYRIIETKPAINFTHHNGWVECTQTDHGVRVDWHSHFTFHTPIIGYFIGWMAKRQAEKVFIQRLEYIRKKL